MKLSRDHSTGLLLNMWKALRDSFFGERNEVCAVTWRETLVSIEALYGSVPWSYPRHGVLSSMSWSFVNWGALIGCSMLWSHVRVILIVKDYMHCHYCNEDSTSWNENSLTICWMRVYFRLRNDKKWTFVDSLTTQVGRISSLWILILLYLCSNLLFLPY